MTKLRTNMKKIIALAFILLTQAGISFAQQNAVLTFAEAKQLADRGDARAQAIVAMHYQLGWQTEKNPELAVKYAIDSANARHPLGYFRLGSLLRAGEGYPKDEQKGLSFQSASIDGLNRSKDPYSQTALGLLVFQGKVIAQNVPKEERYKEAARLYKLAAGGAPGDWTSGFAPAAFNYAMCADAGHGITKSLENKRDYLGKAFHQKYPPALKYVAEQEAKFSESGYKQYSVPKTDPDIVNAGINPETKVWEKASEKGRTSKWATLCARGSGPLTVELRTQYSGYPVSLQAHQFDLSMSAGGHSQSLTSSAQYHIVSESGSELEIGPTLPMEERNLWGLTEYPAIIEFRVTNNSPEAVTLSAMHLEVLQSEPIEKNIVGVVTKGRALDAVLHDFGWGAWRDQKVELAAIYNYPPTGSSPIVQPFTEFSGGQGTRMKIRADQHVDYYTYGGALLLRASEPGRSETFRAFSVADGGYGLVRIPSDVVLPSNRSGYTLTYPADLMLAPGKSKTFTISIASDKSATFLLSPMFLTSSGEQKANKELRLAIETIRPVEDVPIDTVLPMGSNDVVPYAGFQSEVLKSFLKGVPRSSIAESEVLSIGKPYLDYKRPNLLTEDFSDQELQNLGEENKALADALGDRGDQRHLEPAVFSSDKTALLSDLSEPLVHQFDTHAGFSLKVTGGINAHGIDGHVEIKAIGDGQPLAFRAPWSFDNQANEISLQYAFGRSADWMALMVTAESKARIYLLFPRLSNLAFSLPFVLEHEAKSIASNADGTGLLVELSDARKILINLSDSLTRQLVVVPESGGLVSPYKTDVDILGRVRLWLPYKTVADTGGTPTSPVSCLVKAQLSSDKRSSVAWISDLQVGIRKGEHWTVWNLANGTTRSATNQEAAKLQKNTGKIRFAGDAQSAAHIGDISREASFSAGGERFTILELGFSSPPYNRSWEIRCADRFESAFLRLTPYGNGRHHSRRPLFADSPSLSPNQRLLAVSNVNGTEFWIVDLKNLSLAARGIASSKKDSVFTLVSPDGNYLSGDGLADGCVFSDGTSAIPLSRLEVKFNRPDVVLEHLGADKSLVKEARRMRERLVRRSDFKSLEGAALIDIPVVSIKTEVPEKTGDKSLTLGYEASNSTGPLKYLRVFNNGALVQTVTLNSDDGRLSRESNGKVEVDLASGENRLQLIAVSKEGFTSAFAEKQVICTAEPNSRRCFIATVGVSEYKDTRFNLKFAAKDAEDMSKVLAEKAQHRGYQPEILVVKNAEVDGTLVGKLREFLSKAGSDDEVVVFFAGHGLLDKNLEYHFARHDTDFDASENMGITFQDLESLVDGIKPLKRTVLFDTCHSGEVEEEDKQQILAMVRGAAIPAADSGVQVRGVATRGMKVKELEPKLRHTDFIELESLFPDSRRAKGANILTSSSGSEFSMESDAWQNGLFTFAFLNALKDEKTDADGDQIVSFSEAAAAVQDKVKMLSGGHQRPITRGVNREVEVALASFGPPIAPIPSKEKKSIWWPF